MAARVAAFAAAVLLAVTIAPRIAAAADASGSAETTLRFVRPGAPDRVVDLATLTASCGVRTVTIDDPYYERRKQFRVCPLAAALTLGFPDLTTLAPAAEVLLRARDGYVKPTTVARLREPGGWLAFADAALAPSGPPAWEPIDRRQVDPGPFYVVWSEPEQRDVHTHPWPYQLVTVELARAADAFPHTLPAGTPEDSPARRGFTIFRRECLACHAINGEGGTIGPDLNVPRSIVEYRPVEQIKAYIRDPRTFRYTSMPAHPHLSEDDLAALIAYFEAMRTRKHDPRRTP